jgi:NTP pyrophosphatase (non-canonical NTP hydrolase)
MRRKTIGLSDTVLWFAQCMERELRDNDHKTGWSDMTHAQLLARLRQETAELTRAIAAVKSPETIVSEAADVANFAMMIADNVREFAEQLKEIASVAEAPAPKEEP